MVKPNIGTINALIRMTFGFTMLAWATAKMVKNPWRDSYFWVAVMAAMKVAEGITKFCPLTALFEQYQDKQQDKVHVEETPLALTDDIAEGIINPT
ncbi:Protein of unknown function (DUF2892) [Schinkia azotoformans MEV2011]|uniref:Inner membrane protein YgaP-like transmembrane domain-containing protein n=1 Tax=Schinkia azotoformans MEV2011 TaxID=1348973 RepID=A0A072NEX3_SCHAZ|nr:DUF2892 domain-containing protein [Schinkia azotoformans]KEF36254.1 Protein of unknown function (DUF2892) [Schinkia azotoformans MEV2011]MEC1693857.1 DUF2892 domain-containing protein [Schinkia azotoformans]MEC1714668.1 DUF2892 domain-containing protein [Schinkia azotoformans]MEC1724798.1 DUF2892 domain-containing protein [Schinkia azotoformans]MEC1741157.1 DUF2892 domain-containing protein [Schinkia azotoformans]